MSFHYNIDKRVLIFHKVSIQGLTGEAVLFLSRKLTIAKIQIHLSVMLTFSLEKKKPESIILQE